MFVLTNEYVYMYDNLSIRMHVRVYCCKTFCKFIPVMLFGSYFSCLELTLLFELEMTTKLVHCIVLA